MAESNNPTTNKRAERLRRTNLFRSVLLVVSHSLFGVALTINIFLCYRMEELRDSHFLLSAQHDMDNDHYDRAIKLLKEEIEATREQAVKAKNGPKVNPIAK